MTMLDDELHAHFRELRDDDAMTAASFDAVRAVAGNRAGRRRTSRGARSAWWLAAAVIVVVAGSAVALRAWRGRRAGGVAQIRLDVLNWRSPTDALLRQSRAIAGVSQPILGSVLDGVTRQSDTGPLTIKGD